MLMYGFHFDSIGSFTKNTFQYLGTAQDCIDEFHRLTRHYVVYSIVTNDEGFEMCGQELFSFNCKNCSQLKDILSVRGLKLSNIHFDLLRPQLPTVNLKSYEKFN